MQGGRNPFFEFGEPFANFGGIGGFGGQRSLVSNLFGGRDPFDDPFFTRPFGGMFESSFFGPTGSPFVGMHPAVGSPFMGMHPAAGSPIMDMHQSGFLEQRPTQTSRSKGPIIEELNSDDETEGGGENKEEEKKGNPRKHGRSSRDPLVEEPEDEAEGRKSKQMQYGSEFSQMQSQPQTRSFSFQSSSVTYGGANGAYYTSSRTRRTGSDGLTLEESKEANSATGQASHRISKGIHEKGHSVLRKLNSDGRVDTMQMLHNLNEDQLPRFEQVWEGNARRHLPGWSEGFNVNGVDSQSNSQNGPSRGGWALPSTEKIHQSGNLRQEVGTRASRAHPRHAYKVKTDVGNMPGPSWVRSKAAAPTNMDQLKRQ